MLNKILKWAVKHDLLVMGVAFLFLLFYVFVILELSGVIK